MIPARPTSVIAAIAFTSALAAQVIVDVPVKELQCQKAEVTCLSVSPKRDKLLVGLDHGAELFDLESGRKLFTFPFSEDESTVVYYCAFNPNGEYVVLIGFTGKRQVYDVKTGKEDNDLYDHRWIPDPRATKALGLHDGNSAFDRFYQQGEAVHGEVKAKAVRDGAVEFTDGTGTLLRTLTFSGNKDVHHRAPCLFHEDWFITGTDDGHVLFYTLR